MPLYCFYIIFVTISHSSINSIFKAMEQKVNPWSANLTNGLILGLIGIVYSLVIYFLDLYFNKVQGWIFMLAEIVILYFLIKSYRDNFMHGMISYGQALGAGVIICLYYSLIMAVFTYILYTVIDTGLIDKQLAFTEETLQKSGVPQAQIDAGIKMQAKFMKPAFMVPATIITGMFLGLIFSLIAAAFVRKEGNPLIETPENQN